MQNYLRPPFKNALIMLATTALLSFATMVHAQCNSCNQEPAREMANNGQLGYTPTSDYIFDGADGCCATGGCDSTCGSFWPSLGCRGCCGVPGAGYVGDAPLPTYCGMPAPPYPVPYPTPQNVGYTYFACPPVMPHHSLPHYRGIYSFRHGPGLSRTNVFWRPATLSNAVARVHHMFELPR